MGAFVDITGHKYGRLTVIRQVPNQRKSTTRWLCKCECGKYKEIDKNNLLNGHTSSCGCYALEKIKNNEYGLIHGKSRTRIYSIWQSMKQRCFDTNTSEYKYYGMRGITVCNEWLDFPCFADWARTSGYKKDLTIDRIDCDGNYSPDNCRWATIKEQNRNKTTTIYLAKNGVSKSMGEWSELLGIPMSTMANRRNRGCGVGEILNTNYQRKKKGVRTPRKAYKKKQTLPDEEIQRMNAEWGR